MHVYYVWRGAYGGGEISSNYGPSVYLFSLEKYEVIVALVVQCLLWGQKECTNYVIPIAIKFGHFLTVWIGTPESECAPPESRVQSSGSVSSERGYGSKCFPCGIRPSFQGWWAVLGL